LSTSIASKDAYQTPSLNCFPDSQFKTYAYSHTTIAHHLI